MQSNTASFTKKVHQFETGIFSWVIILFAFGLIFLLFDILALDNKPRLAGCISYLGYFSTGTCVVLLAVKIAASMTMLDFCEQVLNITNNSIMP
jgi:hypothetical protein